MVNDMENFAEYVSQERERLTLKRQDALEAKRQADEDLAAVESEFRAITAYEAAKHGKRGATNGSGSGRQRGTRHGGRREEVLAIIQNSAGLKRREILEALGVKGDKSQEMSVSNALSALIKGGSLGRTEDGMYVTSTQPVPATAEAESVAA